MKETKTLEIKDILERAAYLYLAGEDENKLCQLERQLSSILSTAYLATSKTQTFSDKVVAELARELVRRGRINLVPHSDHNHTHNTSSLPLEILIETVGCLKAEVIQNWARAQGRDPQQVLNELEENLNIVHTPDGFKSSAVWLGGRSVAQVLQEVASWPEELARSATKRLDAVRPHPLPFDEAEIELSDPCVAPDEQVQFFRSLIEANWCKKQIQYDGEKKKIKIYRNATTFLRAEWETPNASPERIFNTACGYTRRPSVSPDEQELIDQKIEKLNNLFRKFLEQNPLLKERVENKYQKLHGQFLAPPVSDAPLPFEDAHIQLWPHQRRGARRIAATAKTLLFYPTGAGKTLTALAAIALLKMRRSPAPTRALVIAPANVLHQWAAEAKRLNLRTLVIEQGTSPVSALAKIIAAGAEIVLLAPSTFSMLPSARPLATEATQKKVEKLSQALQALDHSKNPSDQKRRETLKTRLQEERNALLNLERNNLEPIRLDLIPFDLIIVDEVHQFKGYADPRRINSGTQLAVALAERIAALSSTNPTLKTVAMTATPVLNRPEELFALIELLQPELLHNAHLNSPESFVMRFARTERCWETAPAGGWRAQTRIIGWRRRSELCRLLAPLLDAVSPEEAASYTVVPDFTSNQLVTVDPGPLFMQFCQSLIERVEKIEAGQVRNTDDNILLVTTDARRAALHLHMVDPMVASDDPQNAPKVEALARIAAQIKNLSQHGRGLQLVFCDTRFATEDQENKFDLYAYIKARLVAHGFLPTEIALVEAGNKKVLDEIKSKVARGALRIIIGSTHTLGTGLNIQTRLVAIHHLDAPWRPSDVDQRLGRMVRTGNLWKRTHSFIYVLRRSFDAYVWQILERKARTINELLTTTKTSAHQELQWREDLALTAAEARAAASGNPYTAAYLCLLTEQERALRQTAFHSARAYCKKSSYLKAENFTAASLFQDNTEQILHEIQRWQYLLQTVAAKLDSYGTQPLAALPEAVPANFAHNLHPLHPHPGQRLVLVLFPIEESAVALVVETSFNGDLSFYLIDNSLKERLNFKHLPVRAGTLAQYIRDELLPRLERRREVIEAHLRIAQQEQQEKEDAQRLALQAIARAAAAAEVAHTMIPHLQSQGFTEFPKPATVQLPTELTEKYPSLLAQQRDEMDALAQQIVAQWSAPQVSQDFQFSAEDFVLVETSQNAPQTEPHHAQHAPEPPNLISSAPTHNTPQDDSPMPSPEKQCAQTKIPQLKPARQTTSTTRIQFSLF